MRYLFILPALFILILPAQVHGQVVDLSVAIESLSYRGDDFDGTDGTLAVTVAVNRRLSPAVRLGGGLLLGTFDHTPSGSNLTSVGLFGQVSRDWAASDRVLASLGVRAGFEHEHGGSLAINLGGYGWSLGPTGGVDFALGERMFAGGTVTWTFVHLGQGLGPDATSHDGQRVTAGGRIGVRF